MTNKSTGIECRDGEYGEMASPYRLHLNTVVSTSGVLAPPTFAKSRRKQDHIFSDAETLRGYIFLSLLSVVHHQYVLGIAVGIIAMGRGFMHSNTL